MSTALTPGQHALLETELRLARERVQSALQAQRGGADRVAHAAALVADDPRELREHEADRELDQTRDRHLLAELEALDDALTRLKLPGYGRCVDCAAAIPFDRLQRQPQTLRCFDCQTAAEATR
ncbi:TraR/DksA family transcriptional regulator [Roseateles cellulosilyticus]|uniref:TraR/DksA C4-type zinc finger protein n=1 Tax=Pelomonas cellulosilytica TaxID=2906762 RepID=A0ABS8XZT1_9BURK|nr:TraR/DksA C4-type zinc finger protein [Pelomonas sp. P8]MCE4558122.1 TraR/DksA C4-type zinc finger protein [Pelomonas sp. P8]